MSRFELYLWLELFKMTRNVLERIALRLRNENQQLPTPRPCYGLIMDAVRKSSENDTTTTN